jgi:hopanoid biosynthesis associated protein HpnK
MVAGAAAADAVRRAKALPNLSVGLHLVAIEGPAVLPPHVIPSQQLRLGLEYAFHPAVRRQLAAEIRAQFTAYAATGLPLDHADAHKHMHLHPTVGNLLLRIGREFGLRAVRVPAEPPATGALHAWSRLFRSHARRAGMVYADAVFGIADSGHMTIERLLRLIPQLPDGVSEIYCHPASRRDAVLDALMPGYEHEAELAALVDPRLRAMLRQHGIVPTRYGELS